MKLPLIIGIGGAHSGIGKTETAAALLKYFTSSNKLKDKNSEDSLHVTRHSLLNRKWGAIKYTRTAFYSSVVADKAIVSQKDKDTGRFLRAGAEEVLWVQAPPREIGEVLCMAIDRLSHLDGIIVEGNSAIEFLKPDIVIFLVGASKERLKPSAQAVLKLADIIISNESSVTSHELKNKKKSKNLSLVTRDSSPSSDSLQSIDELAARIETVMKRKTIEELLKEQAAGNRISCGLARKIAEELGVPYREVGKAADELKIKIKNCELGCF
ncbi:MAG: hypothetical protein M1510_09375 [Nitrospirae bacterium]|nr:hypothetical protein [Nitrospirota bacterium]MCL5237635.1 hypothetical protein [Nitrospirota bacterium]